MHSEKEPYMHADTNAFRKRTIHVLYVTIYMPFAIHIHAQTALVVHAQIDIRIEKERGNFWLQTTAS